MIRKLSLVLALLLLGSVAIRADSVVTVQPAGTDSVSWVQLGPSFTDIPQNFNFTTASSVNVTGSFANGGGEIRQEWNGWYGNFAPGTQVLWNEGNGALTLNFAQGYNQVGAEIQADFFGAFIGQICDAYGCVTENGLSDSSNNGSAIYLGITGSQPINWVTFSLDDAGPNNFAIGDLTLGGGETPAPTPEPATLLLLGTGLAGIATACRKHFARQH